MSLKSDLESTVADTFTSQWTTEEAETVPKPEALRLNSNHAKDLARAAVLYADLDGSTSMVDKYYWWFSAEVYKTYLHCAAQVIRSEIAGGGGDITAYDGDRIMAVFTGAHASTTAVRTALKINYAVAEIIRPALRKQYSDTNFTLNHVIGVDLSQLRTARIGVRGGNDLVWIGRAANHAAKLCTLSEKPIWITDAVYRDMAESVRLSKDNANMWERRLWTAMNNAVVHCTTFYWPFA